MESGAASHISVGALRYSHRLFCHSVVTDPSAI
jgi:hypothetical protein